MIAHGKSYSGLVVKPDLELVQLAYRNHGGLTTLVATSKPSAGLDIPKGSPHYIIIDNPEWPIVCETKNKHQGFPKGPESKIGFLKEHPP